MKVYARNCQVREIEPDLAREFIEFHHRQGMPKRCSNLRSYGLFRADELLGVIAFCSPRTRHKVLSYQYELLRCCFKDDVRVPGGVSKLIAHFVREVRPASFFTYQDTSGEKTDVYAKAGLTLVEKERPKKVLVKDGLTFASASNNRRDWFSMEQVVRYGPDRLLGTSLGEVLEDGRRLTNVELFERNGYHLETIPGDRVYEWQNSDSIERPWVTRLDGRYSYKKCTTHGRTLHTRNGVCLRCSNKKAEVTRRLCPVHGGSTFAAGTCLSCASSKTFDVGRCLVHGECKVRNGNCVACLNSKKLAFEKTSCVDHGDDNLFVNSRCVRCMFEKDRDLELVLGSKMSPVTGASKDRFVCPRCSSKFVNTVNGILESFLNFSETDFDKIWVQSLCKNCQRPG